MSSRPSDHDQARSGIPGRAIFTGILAGFVGCASSVAVVLQGLKGVEASDLEATSRVMAASVAMGLCGIVLSIKTKMPASVAWSTPGAALLAGSAAVYGGFAGAVGAFLICAGLIVLAGLWRPFGRAVARLPASLANAMLAGILLSLCLAPFKAIAFDPLLGLPIVVAWILMARVAPAYAVPAALAAFVAVLFFGVELPTGWQSQLSSAALTLPQWVSPVFSLEAVLGIALPLFVVTMASQNIPGLAVLRANNYQPDAGPLITTTGVFSFLGAPFGSHAVNLAAITAAMLAGPEAGPDHSKRYWGSVAAGLVYVVFGLTAGVTVAFLSLAPGILIEAVAGLALISAFSAAIVRAFETESERAAAAVTFLAAASGMSLFGISGAFWGLLAGLAMLQLMKLSGSKPG